MKPRSPLPLKQEPFAVCEHITSGVMRDGDVLLELLPGRQAHVVVAGKSFRTRFLLVCAACRKLPEPPTKLRIAYRAEIAQA